jgi:DNA repair exonuclease SbcCD ATPase subunit
MIPTRHLLSATVTTAILFLAGCMVPDAFAQQPAARKLSLTPEQQKQLDRLEQLEDQLEDDRAALEDAIVRFGWDSDEADEAENRLSQNRMEYRKLRRALRQAGGAIPSSAGLAPAGMSDRPWTGTPRWGRGQCHHCGQGYRHCHHCGGSWDDCPGCGM